MMNKSLIASFALLASVILSACGSSNSPIICPAGQVNVNNSCVASGVGSNAITNPYGQPGYGQPYGQQYGNQYGQPYGQTINGVYPQGTYGQYQNGVNGQCMSLYNSGCPQGYIFSPQYNNCVIVQNTYGYGNAYGYGFGGSIGLQYQYQNSQMIQTPYGMFPSGPCVNMCGAGYAYINNYCYR